MTTWVFSKVPADAIRRDPNETELFKTEQSGEGEYSGTDALVREVIQNSLDAKQDRNPVRIRFAIHPQNDMPSKVRLSQYFSRLEPALEFRQIDFDNSGVPSLINGFMVCEDFGTRGLSGDPYLVKDPAKGAKDKQDFYWFWRNIGRSGKTGDDLGRWGLGKTVYRAASRVGCMFGLTVRHSDGKELLMGQAVLRIHSYQSDEYAAEGFWCAGCNNTGTPMPIESSEEVSRFRKEWKLSRQSEPGLSVVIPYAAEELRAESILRLAVVNFFLPIMQGDLIIEVFGPSKGEQRTDYLVDQNTIESICQKLAWNGKASVKLSAAPPIEFTRKCLKELCATYETEILGETKVPTLDEKSFSPETLTILRRKFAAEDVVAVKVRAYLPRKKDLPAVGEMIAFVQRTGDTLRHESYYVREGMTITKHTTKKSIHGVRGLVIVEPGDLASLLGDTEGPAHTTWDTSNDERPNQTWKTWKGRVHFFSGILDALIEVLSPKSIAPDFDLLSDFFSIDQPDSSQFNRRPKKPGEPIKPKFAPPSPTPKWYRLSGRPGGFTIADSGNPPTQVGSILRVSIAYDLPSGNPLKVWCKFDFDFKSKDCAIEFKGNGVIAKAFAGNVLDIEVINPDFQLAAVGFDVHRDLFVRIDEADGKPEGDIGEEEG